MRLGDSSSASSPMLWPRRPLTRFVHSRCGILAGCLEALKECVRRLYTQAYHFGARFQTR
ncbi:hypothetical protein H5410_036482 [Solanum commersonii]|uniref:Uncharacterized protein n=1 Tax=Solanum commersonii TaxID=4109 RepID=A0A9J5Y5F7_SOLCO|nr:hypothetical protein H5410_036482 [Solanum commersonii]